ncbi:MAG: hypothetical protein GYA48_11800 [Chloroflexi bacterium]|nr:hypothetical protein [Chloroflexota bacterium]
MNGPIKDLKFIIEKNKTAFAIVFLILIGFLIRIQHFQLSNSYPINDGGLFVTMTRDLIANNFIIPQYTTYNHLNIPYAYPALSFYVVGLSNTLTGLEILFAIKYLPLFYNLLSIPFFYLLAREITNKDTLAFLAAFVFAISRPSYEWLIMGGGITRSPAYTFSIITLYLYIHGLRSEKKNNFLLSGVFLGLTAAHHLEKAQFAWIALLIITFSILDGIRHIKALITVSCIGGLVFLPFFIPVFQFHGLSPYLNAFGAGEFSLVTPIVKLVMFNFYGITPFIDVFGIFSFIGLISLIIRRNPHDLFLPLWLVIICVMNPRSVDRFAIIPASIMFAYGFNIFSNGIRTFFEKDVQLTFSRIPKSYVAIAALLFVMIFSADFSSKISSPLHFVLTGEDVAAMQWVKENTPENASFAVLPSDFWASDTVGEWFPSLTERTNVLCTQGTEWLGSFGMMQETHKLFEEQIVELEIHEVLRELDLNVDHIYCSENQLESLIPNCPAEIDGFDVIYDQPGVMIYRSH